MVAVANKTEATSAPETGVFQPWYHPTYRAITLRPKPNEQIVLADFKAVPRDVAEDEWLRMWVTQERRGNDPERWHGDNIPDSQPSLECGFCKALFRNYNVHADHIQALHLREELADFRQR